MISQSDRLQLPATPNVFHWQTLFGSGFGIHLVKVYLFIALGRTTVSLTADLDKYR